MNKILKKSTQIIAIMLTILISLFVLSGCGNKDEGSGNKEIPDYEKPVANMFRGMQDKDVDAYISAFPKFMGLADYFNQEYMDYLVETLEKDYGTDIKIKYDVSDKKEISEENIKEMEASIVELYSTTVDIKSGYQLDVEAHITGSEGTDTESSKVDVYQIDNQWYIIGL